MRALFVALLATGCASAEPPGQSGVDSGIPVDGNEVTLDSDMEMIDAMVDAPPGPQTRTLTQTTSQTIKGGNTPACGNPTNGWTSTNNYYRVFDLAALGITTPFTVSKVSFQVEHCDKLSGSGTCTTVAVRVGTYSAVPGATLATGNITILASNATVPVPEVIQVGTTTPGGTVDAPITATIQPNERLLVEIDAPDGTNVYELYMGSNDGGESAPGYILAPSTGCDITTPTSITQAGGAPIHLLLTVTGTY